jgi:two-component system sensor histidine kinase MtrB
MRLVVAFLAVSALSALITATLTFRQARSATLDRTQSTAVHDMRAQLDSLAPDLTFPPTTEDLRGLTLQLDRAGGSRQWRTAATYRNGPPVSAPGAGPTPQIPADLRAAVQKGNATTFSMRTGDSDAPRLTLGMPVAYAPEGGGDSGGDSNGDGDSDSNGDSDAGRPEPSGLVVYADFSLADDRADIAALRTAAEAGAVPALLLALVPALLAARRVLRPVRGLHHGAEKIAAGDLGTRLPETGRDELADLTRTFNTMAAHLEKDDAELRRMEASARRFAADVAHELRTPLAAMTAVTEVLDEDALSGDLPQDTADAVLLISDETRKLARMVEDLMEVSRFDAGAAVLHLDDVELRTLVAKTVQLRGWSSPPVRVENEVPEGIRVRVDPRRIDVVLANLIGNGLRHGTPPVLVRASPGDTTVALTVTDHGAGIPEDVLPQVFDRFYKADSARARSEGSGLGLAIAAENAQLHGATLTAANSPDAGAEFTLTLPLSAPCPGPDGGPGSDRGPGPDRETESR